MLFGVHVTSTFLARMARRIRKERHFFYMQGRYRKSSFLLPMALQSVWDKAMSGTSIFLALLERRVRRVRQHFWH